MLSQILALLSLLITQNLLLINSSIIPSPPPFNLSHYLFPKVTTLTESSIPTQPPHFLQGVLDAIVNKEKWMLDDIRASEVDVKKAKHGSVQRYEFQVRVGKSEIVFKLYEEVTEWNKLNALGKNGSTDFETLVKKIGSRAVIGSFKLEGPFELRAVGADEQLSLILPINISHTGLRRIAVGEGITVEVKGAEEISIINPRDHKQKPYNIFDECAAFPPIRITGLASIVAYKSRRPASYINTIFSSKDALELLSDKCYLPSNYRKPRDFFGSITPLKKFLNGIIVESPKLKISASTVFRFQLELERYIRSNDTYWSTLAEWRTRPIMERVWFKVVARIEDEILQPIVIKKVRPFIDFDSFSWNSLLSNLSFTKFPPVFVPPEALTLDVKW